MIESALLNSVIIKRLLFLLCSLKFMPLNLSSGSICNPRSVIFYGIVPDVILRLPIFDITNLDNDNPNSASPDIIRASPPSSSSSVRRQNLACPSSSIPFPTTLP